MKIGTKGYTNLSCI